MHGWKFPFMCVYGYVRYWQKGLWLTKIWVRGCASACVYDCMDVWWLCECMSLWVQAYICVLSVRLYETSHTPPYGYQTSCRAASYCISVFLRVPVQPVCELPACGCRVGAYKYLYLLCVHMCLHMPACVHVSVVPVPVLHAWLSWWHNPELLTRYMFQYVSIFNVNNCNLKASIIDFSHPRGESGIPVAWFLPPKSDFYLPTDI